ncbi:hypothetical protein [Bacillus infantis]|uniref:hypothetical protein n=1 Tax=Bacillus infantis TaxID=324767 RepID=UPI003CEBF870
MNKLDLDVSLSKRIKQLFCKHDNNSWACYSEGVSKYEGFWYIIFECRDCDYASGRWIEADKEAVEYEFFRNALKK